MADVADIRWRVTVENIADRATARSLAKSLRNGAEEAGVRVEVSGYVYDDGEGEEGDNA